MKIRTQLLLSAAVFGAVLLIVAASVTVTMAELGRLDGQITLAERIGSTSNDLDYIANEYMLYGDPNQIDYWTERYAALSADRANLSAGRPEEQALVGAIADDQQRLKAVFDGIVAGSWGGTPTSADQGAFQVAWSRVGVQSQALEYDASRLSALFEDRAAGLRMLNILLIVALLGAFALLLLTGFAVVGGRTLHSIKALQAGADAIGSGNLEYAIEAPGDDEVGDLAHSFNRMAADLAAITASRAELEAKEAALRESEAKYRNVVELSPDAILIHQNGVVVFANQAAALLVGAGGPEALVGRPILAFIDPGGRDLAAANIERDLRGEETPLTAIELLRDDGTTVPVQGRGAAIPFSGRPAVQVILRDVTRERRAEEELREYAEQLRRSNEDLERFAYVSSHDLQEPLRAIVSFSQLLERRYRGQLGTDADEYIDFIVEGGTRMQTLILDLLAYSRVNTKQQGLRPIDAEEVMAAVERNLDVQLREAGAVLTHDPLPVVLADALQLEQALMNLISNAIKFRRPDVPLLIHVGARRLDGFWEFSVRDNGIGIEKEYFDRIFVIFQRLHTKDMYPGTGIGLAIVKRIIDRHGGRIWVESVPGEGSTFSFTLPAA